jgi:SCY1-like protein 2
MSSQHLLCVLLTRYREEMVEPLEETRSELIFATEPILSSLDMSIPRGSHHTPPVELDEIEVSDGTLAISLSMFIVTQIQKGILQLCKGLSFLHSSAKLIHSNLKPECVIINEAVCEVP